MAKKVAEPDAGMDPAAEANVGMDPAAGANVGIDPAAGAKGAAGAYLVVVGPLTGRWRIGRHFGRDPVVILAADLTEAEAVALRDDPYLSISIVRDEVPAPVTAV